MNFPSLRLLIGQLCANSQQSEAAVQLLLQTERSGLITGTIVFTSSVQPTNFTETTPVRNANSCLGSQDIRAFMRTEVSLPSLQKRVSIHCTETEFSPHSSYSLSRHLNVVVSSTLGSRNICFC